MRIGTPQVPIDRIVVGERVRKDLGDIKVLAASIKEVGLLHPIVVDADYRLIAGRRRLAACKSLGWKKIPVHIIPLKEPVAHHLHDKGCLARNPAGRACRKMHLHSQGSARAHRDNMSSEYWQPDPDQAK